LTVERFNKIWDRLEEKAAANESESGILALRVLPHLIYDINLGFEKPNNKRMVFIKIAKENVLNSYSFPKSKGFELEQTVLPEDKGHYATIKLILNEKQYQDIFTILSEDVIKKCSLETNEKMMLKAFISRLEMWQQFLDRYGTKELGETAQRGLYGELRVLRDVLIPIIGPKKSISSWRGPYKAQQDFQTSGFGIEVKTNSGKQHQNIQIASEQQLDDTGLDALYLYHFSLKVIQNGGENLPGIIDEIRDICNTCLGVTADFEDLLFRAGYLEEQRTNYENIGYADRSSHIFLIKEGFPRITEHGLIDGIGDVHYSINLSACMPFIVSEEELREFIKRNCDE
jgi:hypothetical protein